MSSSQAWADMSDDSESEQTETPWETVGRKKTAGDPKKPPAGGAGYRMQFAKPKKKRPRVVERCTEDHPECMASESQVCVFKIRKTIPCRGFLQGECPYGDDCYFKH